MNGKLYITATPIGNLSDITHRALETLKEVDFVLCEDTRVTKKLLDKYEIKTPTISYHQHSDAKKIKEIKGLLNEGKNLALVTDAGTPGISDPGNLLIHEILKTEGILRQTQDDSEEVKTGKPHLTSPQEGEGLKIIPIPGASAVISALSISGFPTDKYTFMGFPPNKNKRLKYFKEVADSKYAVAFYESSHRIKKCLDNLKNVLESNRQIVIGRELTKLHESIYRGTIDEILEMNIKEKGEFVVVVSSK